MWGTWHSIFPVSEKLEGRVPSVLHLIAPMSMWYQARWFGKSNKTLLTRSRFDLCESFQRSVVVYQAPETFLFSIFLGKEAS